MADKTAKGMHPQQEKMELMFKKNEEVTALVASLDAGRPFTSVAIVEGELSRDGELNRVMQEGSIYPDTLPLPLLYGHDAERVIGRVDKFYPLTDASEEVAARVVQESALTANFDPQNVWIAEGYLATNALGVESTDLIEQRMLRGVSVGAGRFAYNEDDVVVDDAEAFFPIETGHYTFTEFQVIELSVTAQQAIGPAVIWLSDTEFSAVPEAVVVQDEEDLALVAAASAELNSVDPSPDFFDYTKLPKDIPEFMTITDDLQIFGYAGVHGVPHLGQNGVHVGLPREPDYSKFHSKSIKLSNGNVVRCGTITMRTGHAALRDSADEAIRHYDDSGYAVADVVAMDDGKGLLLFGAVRTTLSDEDLRELRGSALSGDWRADPGIGQLRLRAMLAVNVPAFSVELEPQFNMQPTATFGTSVQAVTALIGNFSKVEEPTEDLEVQETIENEDKDKNFAANLLNKIKLVQVKSRLDEII